MKYLFFILITLINICTNKQKSVIKIKDEILSTDSLIKYSYMLWGHKLTDPISSKVNFTNGTGFFIKHQGRLYLITAKHVLSGCNNITLQKRKIYRDIMFVGSSISNIHHALNVQKIQDTSECVGHLVAPDIIAVPVNNSLLNNVYTAEEYISDSIAYKENNLKEHKNNIIIFGYPNETADKFTYGKYSPAKRFETNQETSYYKQIADTISGKVEEINYYLFSSDVVFDTTYQGYSGAPVFIEDSISKKWYIIGVVSAWGIYNGENCMFIVRIKHVLDNIKNRQ